MGRLVSDTIGGFNSVLEKQKAIEGSQVLVSTVLFDDRTEVLYNRIPIKDVKPMNEETYFVRGSTALLDAVGGAIDHIMKVHEYLGEVDRPNKTLFVITTDGHENASYLYNHQMVSSRIKMQTEIGWEFLYLGANVDAYREATKMGIRRERTANYIFDDKGIKEVYNASEQAIHNMRMHHTMQDNWKDSVDVDYKKRNKKSS
jgi:uncharacterized protein YegL